MQGILLDAISEQIKGMQSITRLLTEKLAKVCPNCLAFPLPCIHRPQILQPHQSLFTAVGARRNVQSVILSGG